MYLKKYRISAQTYNKHLLNLAEKNYICNIYKPKAVRKINSHGFDLRLYGIRIIQDLLSF